MNPQPLKVLLRRLAVIPLIDRQRCRCLLVLLDHLNVVSIHTPAALVLVASGYILLLALNRLAQGEGERKTAFFLILRLVL